MNKVPNSNEHRYGNDAIWAFLENVPTRKEIAIWKLVMGNPEIIAKATNQYDAKNIVDALISYKRVSNGGFGKKELAFLDFVKANCPEPYSTMAANAILWNDDEAYNKLRMDFPVIYS